MKHPYYLRAASRCLRLLALGLTNLSTYAQMPDWNLAAVGGTTQLGGTTVVQASALDASGNVVMVGYFTGSVAFGSTTLSSRGDQDVFVAKYVPGTSTWAWVQQAGGRGADAARAVAISNGAVYLTGYLTGDQANSNRVLFGSNQAQSGASPVSSRDVFVAKYTDAGTNPALSWVAVAGGSGDDQGAGVAVSGTAVYVTGQLTNNLANAANVVFGPSGPTAGTSPQAGASTATSFDLLLARYTDQGNTAAFSWSQVAGGTGDDLGRGVATTGTSVYVTGSSFNSLADANTVRLGGSGLVPGSMVQAGTNATASADLLLAKYTDEGSRATPTWSQTGGGASTDRGVAVAVSGAAVYVTGFINSNRTNDYTVRLGGSGTTAGTVQQAGAGSSLSNDWLLARYQDNGSNATVSWSQVAGGVGDDQPSTLAVSGTAVYVTGSLYNNSSNGRGVYFGGSGLTLGTVAQAGSSTVNSQDVAVARYQDNGSSATVSWSQVAGSTADDYGLAVVANAAGVYVSGTVGSGSAANFGTAIGSPVRYTSGTRAVLGTLAPGTGTWQAVAATSTGGSYSIADVAPDGQGNLLVAGSFDGQVTLGSTVLGSQGGGDLFVAKYVPATNTWAWVLGGGGLNGDGAVGIALSGSNIYVLAQFYNNTANADAVRLDTGGPGGTTTVRGASSSESSDLLLLKYTDQGSTGALVWTQVAGGLYSDSAGDLAVTGTSVYATGTIQNDRTNDAAVVFGGNGTTAGTRPQYGVQSGTGTGQDAVLAKWTDNGTTATFRWSQVAGGSSFDLGAGVAVRGSSVYMVGTISNDRSNSNGVVFGASGTSLNGSSQAGASTDSGPDHFLAKYTDNGGTASFIWSQVAGGSDHDYAKAVAVSGSSVYMTGYMQNDRTDIRAVRYGGSGSTVGTAAQAGASSYVTADLVLAKYTDNGADATFGWSQVGGGSGTDQGYSVAASGNSVYVTGSLYTNSFNANQVSFGGSGTTPGTASVGGVASTASFDLVLAKYLDNGRSSTYQWAKVAGSAGQDAGIGVAVSSRNVYVATVVETPATFGSLTVAGPVGSYLGVLAGLTDPALLLPTRASTPGVGGLSLFPNPAPQGTATLTGGTPGTAVQVLDMVGRVAATATTDAAGTTALGGLAPGLYLVRVGAGSVRLVVE